MIAATARAKVNLSLHITGKRPDGYHLLDSLVCFADVGDALQVSAADDLTLGVEGPFASAVSVNARDNLVWRAAELVREQTGATAGAAITLVKNLPVAAGLGGGSSDAATAAKLLCRHWGVIVPPALLAQWLAPLGADLPVCVHGKAAWMSGIGEVVEPCPSLPSLPVLLVNPGIALRAKDVYARAEVPTGIVRRPMIPTDVGAERLMQELERLRNDLQRPAISLASDVAEVLLALSTSINCRLARMSGSGATCFGIFEDGPSASRAAERIRSAYPGWWVQETRLG